MAHDEDPRDGNIQWRPVYQTSRALTKAERAYAVPPLWSGFPDFGPDPDFALKSGFFIKIRKERLKMQNFSVC